MFLPSFVKGGEYSVWNATMYHSSQVSERHCLMAGTVCPTKLKWLEIFVSPALEVMCLCLSSITVIHATYVLNTDTNMFA